MKKLQKPDAVLFDWDGTLVDTLDILVQGYNDVFTHFEMPLWGLDEGKQNIRTSSRETFPKLFGENSDKATELYYASVRQKHLALLKKMDAADEFLKLLKSKNIKTGVISNKRDELLKKEITHLGWDHYFDVVIGAGVANRDKPAPDCMEMAKTSLGLNSGIFNIWYVGDTDTDIEFSHNSDTYAVFLTHGFGTLEDAKTHKPDLILSNLEDLGKELDTAFNLL